MPKLQSKKQYNKLKKSMVSYDSNPKSESLEPNHPPGCQLFYPQPYLGIAWLPGTLTTSREPLNLHATSAAKVSWDSIAFCALNQPSLHPKHLKLRTMWHCLCCLQGSLPMSAGTQDTVT